jgi:two-component system response regulator AtoC
MQKARKTILVVEDDSLFLWSLECFLEREGYQVSPAGSGEEGINLARNRPFDVVISDFQLPGMNGRQLIEELKNLQPAVKTLLISAHQLDEVNIPNASLPDAYLNKPIELGMLKKLLEELAPTPLGMGH